MSAVRVLGCLAALLMSACITPAAHISVPLPAPTPAPPPPAPATNVAVPFVQITGPDPAEATSLKGAGSTFAAPLYATWFAAYQQHVGVQVDYQAIGSAGGITRLSEVQVDFGASDAPMTDAQLAQAKGGPVLHIPMALGAIVLTYNLPELNDTPLRLTPDTVAGIYLGDIRRWDDPRLVADNPALGAVHQDIISLHRSDGSGTTFGFTDYLSAVSPTWAQRVGRDTSVFWPIGTGAVGNGGVSAEVLANAYSIGYTELTYAQQQHLPAAVVRNQNGEFVVPSPDSVTSAASGFAGALPADLRFSLVNSPGAGAYPISTATWMLVYQRQPDRAHALALTRLLSWATHDAQAVNPQLAYASLPPNVVTAAESLIQRITSP